MILDRESLLKPRSLNVKQVEIDGLGLVRLRQLNHSEVTEWNRWKLKNETQAELKLVSLCLVDEQDQPILTEGDLSALAKHPATVVALLVYETMVVNGFMKDVEPEEALKLFDANPERLFMCRLAGKFNVPNVDVFSDSLTDDQLREWKAVALLDGWFDSEQWVNSIQTLDEQLAIPKPGMMTPEQAEAFLQKQAG